MDLALILDGEKFFTSEASRRDQSDPARTGFTWTSGVPSWIDGQEVELELRRAKRVAVDVLTATMTAGGNNDNGGYSPPDIGSLSPSTFSVRGVDYTVEEIYRVTKAAVPPDDPAIDELLLDIHPAYPTDFTLHLWGEEYDSSDATTVGLGQGAKRYTWADPFVTFEERRTFRASIEAEVPFLYDDDVPSAPSPLTVTVIDPTTVRLSWTTPDSDGGLSITGYQIEVSSDPGYRVWAPLKDNTNSRGTVDLILGLEPGTTRSYRVRARNLLGRSEPSNQVEATTPVEKSCDIYCATVTVGSNADSSVLGYSTNIGFIHGGSISDNSFTLAGADYMVNGLINAKNSGEAQIALNSLPPESAVEGLSLYVGDVELPFGEAARNTGANPHFTWTDLDNFGAMNTIFQDGGTVDVRIDKEFENVVTIVAKTASVEFGDIAEFTMTRTGNLANGLLVKVYYAERDSAAGCVWFGEGQRTLTAKHYASDRDDNFNKHTSVTFRVDPYVAGEYCGGRANGIRYDLPYKVGSANSAAVTVTP